MTATVAILVTECVAPGATAAVILLYALVKHAFTFALLSCHGVAVRVQDFVSNFLFKIFCFAGRESTDPWQKKILY